MEFAHISEVRSLIPHGTKVMALTATATTRVRQVILSSLDMRNSHLIVHVPNKVNIKYHVCPREAVKKMLHPIVTVVCSHGVDMDRTIIFCRTYQDTLEVFKTLICELGRRNASYLVPACDPERHKHRVCEKYDGSTASDNQSHIVESFTKADGAESGCCHHSVWDGIG